VSHDVFWWHCWVLCSSNEQTDLEALTAILMKHNWQAWPTPCMGAFAFQLGITWLNFDFWFTKTLFMSKTLRKRQNVTSQAAMYC
jgi:hypothetical protein